MENPPIVADKPSGPSKPWSFTFSMSWDGPGLPSHGQTVEFLRSLSRRDLAIVGAALLLVFVIEPLFLYWLFSANLRSRLETHTSAVTAVIADQVRAEVGPAMKEALSQQFRTVTPLTATDPTSLVIPSPAAPPPPSPGKVKP